MDRIKQYVLLLGALLLLLVSCDQDIALDFPVFGEIADTVKNGGEPDAEPKTTEEPEEKGEPAPSLPPGEPSLLTGLPIEGGNRRPVAVMINNHQKAIPQSGISSAGIVYECEFEGGTTRMCIVVEGYEALQTVGSVRSIRPYMIDLAMIHDAVIINAGGSGDAYAALKSRKADYFDGVNVNISKEIFWRDGAIAKQAGMEHSMFTSGAGIAEGIAWAKCRTELREGFSSGYQFSDQAAPNGKTAEYIRIPYSPYVITELFYQDGQYVKSVYGKEQTDKENGRRLCFDNVLVLRAKHKVLDEEGRLEITLTGEGEGDWFCGGKTVPIRWRRESADGPISYQTETGEPLVLKTGKTFVSIVDVKKNITVE